MKIMKGMKEHCDMSEYSKESGLYDGENKEVIGKFKDESPDEVIESLEKNSFDDYKKCALVDKPKNVTINAIRTVKMVNYSLTQNKLALSNKDDKRVWKNTSSTSWGH
jgi:hypothetical protein